ncbi:MAG: RIP metalloprotease RseP [Oscillospiraceae bacterium]|nr:RIP metalloprotease RseP [Oscillospiraceae bacterium]
MSLVITLAASVLVFGVIILAHEMGHYLAARFSGIKVLEFSLGMGPAIIKWTRNDTRYSIRLLPIGGYCSMEGENEESDDEGSFSSAPVGNRMFVILAGAVLNFLLGFLIIVGLTLSSDSIWTRTVSAFSADAVTKNSGLEVGDTILAINGRNMYVANDILYEMLRIKGNHADVVVERDGKRMTLEDVEFAITQNADGVNDIRFDFGLLGVKKNVGNVLRESVMWTVSIARLIFMSLVDIITGHVAINQLSGPVGIIEVIGQAASVDFYSLFYILAIITINLGVMNVLPLPALDGGRLLILLSELLTGKRINPRYEGYIHASGFVLLMLLMVFVTYNDITKLFVR